MSPGVDLNQTIRSSPPAPRMAVDWQKHDLPWIEQGVRGHF